MPADLHAVGRRTSCPSGTTYFNVIRVNSYSCYLEAPGSVCERLYTETILSKLGSNLKDSFNGNITRNSEGRKKPGSRSRTICGDETTSCFDMVMTCMFVCFLKESFNDDFSLIVLISIDG